MIFQLPASGIVQKTRDLFFWMLSSETDLLTLTLWDGGWSLKCLPIHFNEVCSIHVPWNITELEYFKKKKLSSCELNKSWNRLSNTKYLLQKIQNCYSLKCFHTMKSYIMAVSSFFQSERNLNQKNYISRLCAKELTMEWLGRQYNRGYKKLSV